MSKAYFDNDEIRHLEAILDQTLADLKIDNASVYVRGSREFIGRCFSNSGWKISLLMSLLLSFQRGPDHTA